MDSGAPTKASDLRALVEAFVVAAEQAGVRIDAGSVVFEFHAAPHQQPSRMSASKRAIYWFSLDQTCLKVGQAGPNSNARYTSQHYNPRSSNSNLAKSILKHREKIAELAGASRSIQVLGMNESTVGNWMKTHLTRCNLLVDESFDKTALTLLESFVQARLHPLFEGRMG